MAFFLADPLKELYPRCFREALEIAHRARSRGASLLNPPEALSNSLKGRQARLWREEGIPTPPARRVRSRSDLREAADRFGFPLVLRDELSHAQRGLRVLRDREELAAADPRGAWMVASPFVDTRASYRELPTGWQGRVDHPPLWRRYHHKMRVYVLGGRLVPYHLFFSENMVVSVSASIYGDWYGWLFGAGFIPWPLSGLALLSPRVRRAIDEEERYAREGPDAPEILRRAASVLGLGYCALDYSTRADGSLVLWEANPHPATLTPGHVPLRRERGADRRTERLYDEMGELFRRLLVAGGSGGGGTEDRDVE